MAVLKRWRVPGGVGSALPVCRCTPPLLPSRMFQRALRGSWRSRVPAPTRSEVLVSRRRGRSPGGLVCPPWGTIDGVGKGGVALGRPCAAWSYFCPRCEFRERAFQFHVTKVSGRSFGVLVAATLGPVCSGFCSLVKQGLKPVSTVFDRLVSHASIDFEGYPQWV